MVGGADGNPRHLTPQELARLQTFPDAWTFTGQEADQMRQIGNAVPVDLAALLARQIVASLSEVVQRAA
jgi:DNA (cytosine-5)-methyltransferase 1